MSKKSSEHWPSIDVVVAQIESSGFFDKSYYLSQFDEASRPAHPAEHFLLEGDRKGLRPSEKFHTQYVRTIAKKLFYLREVNALPTYLKFLSQHGVRPRPLVEDFGWSEVVSISKQAQRVLFILDPAMGTIASQRLFDVARKIKSFGWEVGIFMMLGSPPTDKNGAMKGIPFFFRQIESEIGNQDNGNIEFGYFAQRLCTDFNPSVVVAGPGDAWLFLEAFQLRLVLTVLAFGAEQRWLTLPTEIMSNLLSGAIALVLDATTPAARTEIAYDALEIFSKTKSKNWHEQSVETRKFVLQYANETEHIELLADFIRWMFSALSDALEMQKRGAIEVLQVFGAGKSHYFLSDETQEPEDAVLQYCAEKWNQRRNFDNFVVGLDLELFGHLNSVTQNQNPLLAFLRAGQPRGPWSRQVIVAHEKKPHKSLRTAIHGHFYHVDVLPDLLKRIKASSANCDVFVSVSSEAAEETAINISEKIGVPLRCKVMPNRGRNFGPLFTGFRDELFGGDYELVGHFHGKKSLYLDRHTVELWRSFLFETLVGGNIGGDMIAAIQSAFAENNSLGLVIPGDKQRHDWGNNVNSAHSLMKQLGVRLDINAPIEFSAGGMFWCRPKALQTIVDARWSWDDYPAEPLKADGSMLHALERMIPDVANMAGFNIALAHVPQMSWSK